MTPTADDVALRHYYLRSPDGTVSGPVGIEEYMRWMTEHNGGKPCVNLKTTTVGEKPERDAGTAADVSTIFLCINHNWFGGAPTLWETMVFGGSSDAWQERYVSEEEALRRHDEIVEALKRGEALE